LRQRTPVHPLGYRELIESRAASIIMLDVDWTGGLTESKKIANWAETYYLPIAARLRWTNQPSCGMASLCVATPNLMIMETVRRHYGSLYGKIATPAGAVSGGQLGLPPGSGLGVELRPEFLSSPDVRIESCGAPRLLIRKA
jgi:galactonate dehydratase